MNNVGRPQHGERACFSVKAGAFDASGEKRDKAKEAAGEST